jgi:hypothetical protein
MDEIGICNHALMLLAEKTIQSLDEDTNEARACNVFYQLTRDACLREIKPNFAIARTAQLGAGTAPPFGYASAFDLPQDCTLVLGVFQAGQPLTDRDGWVREGQQILCNYDAGIQIRYIRTLPNIEAVMDASFVQAFSAFLAAQLTYTLTSSSGKLTSMVQLYELRKAECENQYGQESSTRMITNTQLTAYR